MKPVLLFAVASLLTFAVSAQKPNTQSPIAHVTGTSASGATIHIRYNQPSVRGRSIGKDLEPLPGKVWRTGADSATAFEVNKAVKVEGKELPAGRYGLFTIANGDEWTIIFSKNVKQWGAFTYKQEEDILRVKVKAKKTSKFQEQFTITISNKGNVNLQWGDSDVEFHVD